MTDTDNQLSQNAGLFRRTSALIYDLMIIIAILFLASAIAILIVVMFIGTEAVTEQRVLIENPLYFAWLMFCWFYYYAWCWRNGGQTLGMKTWRLKLVSDDGEIISYKNSLIRFASSLFGIANIMLLLPEKRGWQDTLSHSNIIFMPK